MDKTEAYDTTLNALKKITLDKCICFSGDDRFSRLDNSDYECPHEIADKVLDALGWTLHSITIPVE